MVEHNLAKVGVEGSNPFARSRFPEQIPEQGPSKADILLGAVFVSITIDDLFKFRMNLPG